MEACLQDADCLANRVSIKLLLSGRPWRQEQAITAILCLLRVAKRVCLSSYSIRRDDLQEHQARLRDSKLHSRLWNRRKHSISQLSKMFTLGLGIPKVGMPIGRVPTRWRLRFDHVSSYYPGSKEGHIPTRRASEGSGAFPSLARRVNMQQHAELSCRGNIKQRFFVSTFEGGRSSPWLKPGA